MENSEKCNHDKTVFMQSASGNESWYECVKCESVVKTISSDFKRLEKWETARKVWNPVFWRYGKRDGLQHATPTDSEYVKAICGTWHPNGRHGWIDAGPDCVLPKCEQCEKMTS